MIVSHSAISCLGSLRLLLVLLLGVGGMTGLAQDPPTSGNDLVKVRVLSDVVNLMPSQQFTIAVEYTIEPGWHIYWRNPGASGTAPVVDISAPDGFEIGALQFPRPRIFGTGADTTYGYDGTVLLMVPLTAPPSLSREDRTFTLELEWLVCKQMCLLGESRQTLRFPVAAPGRAITRNQRADRLIQGWKSRVPRSTLGASAPPRFSAVMTLDDRLVLRGIAGAAQTAVYLPGGCPGVAPKDPGPISGKVQEGVFSFDIPMSVVPEDSLGGPLRANGLILLGTYERPRALQIDVPIPTPPRDEAESEGSTTTGS